MQSVTFPQANAIIAKDQKEYQPLHAYVNRGVSSIPVTVCMQLSPDELKQINETGQLWITQLTFGYAYSPLMLDVRNPFEPVADKEPIFFEEAREFTQEDFDKLKRQRIDEMDKVRKSYLTGHDEPIISTDTKCGTHHVAGKWADENKEGSV